MAPSNHHKSNQKPSDPLDETNKTVKHKTQQIQHTPITYQQSAAYDFFTVQSSAAAHLVSPSSVEVVWCEIWLVRWMLKHSNAFGHPELFYGEQHNVHRGVVQGQNIRVVALQSLPFLPHSFSKFSQRLNVVQLFYRLVLRDPLNHYDRINNE
ncbi:hypothetical protein TNCV_3752701 [Trichonephila clavipes]|nr:hypothetical protein TNCV_3752701 [Trichonephila clavipes]